MSHLFTRRAGGGLVLLTALLLVPRTLSGQRARSGEPAAPVPPKLVVLLTVDQMRADYVDRYQSDWTGGLKRLLTQGARFTNAAYPYLETYTCAGHATVSTGTFPHIHGVFQNTWFDRERGQPINCTDDETAESVTYSGKGRNDGPGRLLIPTFADEMRAQRSARVVSLSLKARSAIMMAGRGGDAVVWMTDALDGWQTSKAYAATAVPAVQAYVDAHPIDADYGKVWQRMMPPSRYPEPDAGEGEAPVKGWTSSFPHVLKGAGNAPDAQYHEQWQHSPFADDYLGRMAAALTESLRLGKGATTDVLAVSFSSPDLIGHQFGPASQEVRDLYARLDRTIGLLLARLDTLVGRNQYVVVLTADHGVGEVPEQRKRRGQSAGRLSGPAVNTVVQRAAETVLGPGQYAARVVSNDVYFQPGIYDRLRQQPGALDAVIKALTDQEGIDRVFRSEEVAGAISSSDQVLRAAALSYVPNRSGDLLLITKPGWMFSVDGTTHGSATADDQRVPIVFMGRGIRQGIYADAVTPADIAPTLAVIAGIRLPRAEGHVLTAALSRAPAAAITR